MNIIPKKIITHTFRWCIQRFWKYESLRKVLLEFVNSKTPNNPHNRLRKFLNVIKKNGYSPISIYDIGANRGTWTRECAIIFPDAEYYLFEPQKKLIPEIKGNLRDFKNYNIFSVGVGNRNGILDFTIHERDDSCSFAYTTEEATNRGFSQIELPIVRLDDFARKNRLKSPSILKIDAEGLDLEVLEGAGDLISESEIILLEVSIMNKRIPNSALKVLNYMDSRGFRLFDITDMNRPFSNRVLWLSEFAFIKKNGILDKNYAT